MAVEEALESNGELPQPLYFYCSRNANEPERANADDIARSLVKQLCLGNIEKGTHTIPEYVINRFQKTQANGFAAGQLLFDECCKFLSAFIEDQGFTLIFVDALDECTDEARDLLIRMFNGILEKSSSAAIKILISSRDSPNLLTLFDDHQKYEICVGSDRNQGDVDRYVDIQLSQRIRQKRLVLDGVKPPSTQLREFIATKLCEEAQGM